MSLKSGDTKVLKVVEFPPAALSFSGSNVMFPLDLGKTSLIGMMTTPTLVVALLAMGFAPTIVKLTALSVWSTKLPFHCGSCALLAYGVVCGWGGSVVNVSSAGADGSYCAMSAFATDASMIAAVTIASETVRVFM